LPKATGAAVARDRRRADCARQRGLASVARADVASCGDQGADAARLRRDRCGGRNREGWGLKAEGGGAK
jgi:hypothetical protein